MIDKNTISDVNDYSRTSLTITQNVLGRTGEALNDIRPITMEKTLASELSTSTKVSVHVETVHSSETLLPMVVSQQSLMRVKDNITDSIPKDHYDDMPEVAWQYMSTFSDNSYNSSEPSMASENENYEGYQNSR